MGFNYPILMYFNGILCDFYGNFNGFNGMGSINFNGLGSIIHYNPLNGNFTLWLNLLKMTIYRFYSGFSH